MRFATEEASLRIAAPIKPRAAAESRGGRARGGPSASRRSHDRSTDASTRDIAFARACGRCRDRAPGCGSPIKTGGRAGSDLESPNANAINQRSERRHAPDPVALRTRDGTREDPLPRSATSTRSLSRSGARRLLLARRAYPLATAEETPTATGRLRLSVFVRGEAPEPANPFDCRLRVACDLYNYGLEGAAHRGRRPLPDGGRPLRAAAAASTCT
jgi:hypothetical protein